MKKTTYNGITPKRLYPIGEVLRLMRTSKMHLFKMMTDPTNPLHYVVDKKTQRMKIEGSELIRYFKINE